MEENNERYNSFNKLIEATKTLYKLTNLLCEVEIKRGKDNIYNKLVEDYKKLLVEEKKIYDALLLNEEILIDYINYLHKRYKIEEINIEPDSINSLEEKIVYKRIFNKISELIFKLPFDDEVDEYAYDDCFSNKTKEEREIIRKKCIVNEYIEKDVLMLFLSIIENNLELEELKEYKTMLVKMKYNLAFVFEKVENDLLSDNFKISDSPYMVSKMISDLLFISSEDYGMIKLVTLRGNINDNIRYIMNLGKNPEDTNKDDFIKIIISSFLLESAMLFNSEDKCEIYFEKESGREKALANYRVISLKKN